MPKVGMILDAEFPPDPRVENEALTLIAQGFEVHLLCFGYRISADENFDYQGIKVHRKRCPNWVYKLSALAYTYPFYHWITRNWIRDFVEENHIDVVHVHDMQIYRAVYWANAGKRPLVLDLHENRPEIMKFYSHVQQMPGKLLISPKRWQKFEFEGIKSADHVIVVTEEAKTYYQKEVPVESDKIVVLPNTVRSGFYEVSGMDENLINRLKSDFVILYVGDTGLRRGLITAIESIDKLRENIPNINLVIVGSNKSDVVLKQRVRDLGLESYVSFEGWQNFETFPSYIESSAICISPLHRNLHHDTTYANKIFQYMSMGKPVIVSNCPAQENVIRRAEAGLVFEAENVQQLADQIFALYQKPEERNRLGEHGKAFVRTEFSWEKTSVELIELYEKFK